MDVIILYDYEMRVITIILFIYLSLPEGLGDVSKFPDLIAELLRRGYTEEEVKKVVGENLIRVFEKAEQVSQSDNMQMYACK